MICEKCFGDKFILDHIKSKNSQIYSLCEYCESENISAILPIDLLDIISPLLGLYLESDEEDAKSLIFYFRRDWNLLVLPDENKANLILDAIFVNEAILTKKFKSKQSQNSRLNLWNDFQNELKHINRFFPKIKLIDQEELKFLFSFLILKNPPDIFFRARISERDSKYDNTEMGKPPEKIAKAGRANPIGISYLYTASDVQAAIAEVRPSVGDHISVATYKSMESLVLLDLRNPKSISPFQIEPDDQLKLLNDIEFLSKLGEQLSRPVLPREAELEYLASQYLCEMIKHFNYDGVVYNSSVSSGYNIAFFDDRKIKITEPISIHCISKVNYEHQTYAQV